MKRKKRGNKGFSLKREYKESWRYLKESKKFINIILGIFVVFLLIGAFVPVPESISNQIMKLIEDLLEKTKGMSVFELMTFIFFNNLQSSFLGFILGAGLGIFSVITALSNGYLLGFVAAMSVAEGGSGVLWKIFPHGIFELPAIFIALGLGLKQGSFIFQEKKGEAFTEYLQNSFKTFILIVIPLLIVAAIIEGVLIFLSR